jgi:hypothetical protein
VPVTDVADRNTGDHVIIAFARGTVQKYTFRALDGNVEWIRRSLCNPMQEYFNVRVHSAKIHRNNNQKKAPAENCRGITKHP